MVLTPTSMYMHTATSVCINTMYVYIDTIWTDNYRSIPGKHPPHGKCPGSHFRGMNGERPLPDKRPGILSTVRNGKHPGHVSIFDQYFTSFFFQRLNCPESPFLRSFLCHPYSIASAVHYGVRYMKCMCIGNVLT